MELKKIYFGLESFDRMDGEGGREKIGTYFHCRHKLGDNNYIYVDIDPPNYVTFEGRAFGITSLNTIRIVPAEGGSRFKMYDGRAYEDFDEKIVKRQQELTNSSVTAFASVIADEIKADRIDPQQSDADAAQKTGFGRPDVADGRLDKIPIKNTA